MPGSIVNRAVRKAGDLGRRHHRAVRKEWAGRHEEELVDGPLEHRVTPLCLFTGKQLALLKTNSAVRTCGFDFGGNIIMFSTDKQMGYQCFVSFFDLRDPSQIGEAWGQGESKERAALRSRT